MKIVCLIFQFFLYSQIVNAKNCLINRAAIDIGSGTTKFLAASVNICERKLIKIIYDEKVPTSFNENLEKSAQHKIDTNFAQEQIIKIQPHIKKLKEFKVDRIRAVATSAFRMAANGKEIAQQIAQALKIKVQMIDQETEARIGYQSALVHLGLTPDPKYVVWDIGGGSMQMFHQDIKSNQVYIGQLASVSFKNFLIEVFLGKNLSELSSPNPMLSFKNQSVQFAESYARIHIPPRLKELIPNSKVIGVGGVLSQSIANQANKSDQISIQEIEAIYNQKVKLSDEQLTGNYKSTDVSNLALVIGYMRALKIQSFQIANASLTHGLLFQDF